MTTPHNRTSTAYDMSLFDTSKRKEQQIPENGPEKLQSSCFITVSEINLGQYADISKLISVAFGLQTFI